MTIVKMLCHLSLSFLLFTPLASEAAKNLSIDDAIDAIIASQRSPFVRMSAAKRHPFYRDLEAMAELLDADVRWVGSVAGAVRGLPFHEDRYKFSEADEFDGWFDEFTSPNLILIHRQATMVILVHELRHALHLGTHSVVGGNEYDQTLRRAKLEVVKLHQELATMGLKAVRSKRLKTYSTRLVESFSEVMAHHGDYRLAEAFGHSSVEAQKDFIASYKAEFRRTLKALKKDPLASLQPFVKELETAFEAYTASL